MEILRYRATGVWRWDTKPPPSHASVKKKKKTDEVRDDDAAAHDNEDDGDEQEEVCGICRSAFDDTCPDCTTPGDDCPPVWGVCKHMFHMHCIVKWLESANDAHHAGTQEERRQCPMCRVAWEFRQD